jgi:hypothetical protein
VPSPQGWELYITSEFVRELGFRQFHEFITDPEAPSEGAKKPGKIERDLRHAGVTKMERNRTHETAETKKAKTPS